jgi:hypothetical protein
MLLDQRLELRVAGDGLLHGLQLIRRDVAGNIPAVFPGLMVVVGPVGPVAQDAQFAALHLPDLRHLLQEGLRRNRGRHGWSV